MTFAGLEHLILNIAWPFLLAYAWYRIILAIGGRYATRRSQVEALVAGLGGAIACWGRAIYGFAVPLDWPFALTVLAAALMVAPKLMGIALNTSESGIDAS